MTTADRALVPMHSDCVVCLDAAREPDPDEEPGEGVLIVVALLFAGADTEDIRQGLCFKHRREAEETARHMVRGAKGGQA